MNDGFLELVCEQDTLDIPTSYEKLKSDFLSDLDYCRAALKKQSDIIAFCIGWNTAKGIKLTGYKSEVDFIRWQAGYLGM